MEVVTVKDEQNAEESYQSFVVETNAAIEEKRMGIVNKKQDKGKMELQLEAKKTDLGSATEELAQLGNVATALHESCDFLLKNFELRQEGFVQETEALRQAKAILSGMDS